MLIKVILSSLLLYIKFISAEITIDIPGLPYTVLGFSRMRYKLNSVTFFSTGSSKSSGFCRTLTVLVTVKACQNQKTLLLKFENCVQPCENDKFP